MCRRKFRRQTSDNMDRWKKHTQPGRKSEERRSEREKVKREKMQVVRKGKKTAKHCVSPIVCGSGGSKSRLAKAAVRSQLARWEMKNCTRLWREAHFQVKSDKNERLQSILKWKCLKTLQRRTVFGSGDVEKGHTDVARSKFGSQRCRNRIVSEYVCKLRYLKSARGCGAKHIFKSKCWRRHAFELLLEVGMSIKCAPSWRKNASKSKNVQN